MLSLAPGEFHIFLNQTVEFPIPGLVDWASIVTGFLDDDFSSPILYPNPVSDWLTIDWDSQSAKVKQIKIMDIRGSVYSKCSFKNLDSFWKADVSGMKPGVYLVELTTKKERQIFRFAVQ